MHAKVKIEILYELLIHAQYASVYVSCSERLYSSCHVMITVYVYASHMKGKTAQVAPTSKIHNCSRADDLATRTSALN